MHTYTILENTSTNRKLRFGSLRTYRCPDGTPMHVRTVHWEARDDGFPARLWLTDRHGDTFLVDPNSVLPMWLADTAPDWADRAPKAVR